MGLLQAAYDTYESQKKFAGIRAAGQREALLPVSHIVQNAAIEIEISTEGKFIGAKAVEKEDAKTILPATEKSAGRTGNDCAHPLCDQLRYLAPFGGNKFAAYHAQLKAWAESPYTHTKVQAVLAYIEGGTILNDLASSTKLTLNPDGTPSEGKIQGTLYDKCFVRWRVLPAPAGVSTATWEDVSLFESFLSYEKFSKKDGIKGLCAITGKEDYLIESNPKGTIAKFHNAKLISFKDNTGFTYHGRFTDSQQACMVGYTASLKAHSALRWLCANADATLGTRTFLCWNPAGRKVPKPPILRAQRAQAEGRTAQQSFTNYKKDLLLALGGYRQALPPNEQVVLAALDVASKGRLSVTYFQQLQSSDFLDRLQSWYESCCWKTSAYGITYPSLRSIVKCAFGTEQKKMIEVNDKLLAEHTQQLLPCITECRPIPSDIVRALAVRAGTPLAYSSKTGNYETVLWTACAVIRKYHNDQLKREAFTLELDLENRDRSYLFGRLLAVLEQVEQSTYDREETRTTNAIRMQAFYTQRPFYAWRILEEALNPYFARLKPGHRAYYKNIIAEITAKLPDEPAKLSAKLEDTYLLGYYLQRTALHTKKSSTDNTEKTVTEEN